MQNPSQTAGGLSIQKARSLEASAGYNRSDGASIGKPQMVHELKMAAHAIETGNIRGAKKKSSFLENLGLEMWDPRVLPECRRRIGRDVSNAVRTALHGLTAL